MSWATIAAHLKRVMDECPPSHAILHNWDCARAYIRLREIAEYLDIEYTRLSRIRKGERLNDKIQARLSWFFNAQLKGRIAKEQLPDGKWHIVYRDPQSQAHSDEAGSGKASPSRTLPRIIFTDDGVRLKL